MKNTLLWGALFSLICTQSQAETTQQPAQPQTTTSVTTTTTTDPQTQQVQPATQTTTTTTAPAQVTVPATPVINCDYKIPADAKLIDQSVILAWSEKATVQSFEFDPASLDAQMQKLKNCFTDQGWDGFNSALEKSGNVEAIKAQHLNVSSQIDGKAQMTEAKDNQWVVTLPLQVVYQNDKEKVTQLLNIKLTVNRKITGDLGIAQMVATPRPSDAPVASTTPNNSNPTTPATPTAGAAATPSTGATSAPPTTATDNGTPTTPTQPVETTQPATNGTNTPIDQQPATGTPVTPAQ